jgi:hypothetical protein
MGEGGLPHRAQMKVSVAWKDRMSLRKVGKILATDRMLSHEQAQAFYERFGKKQDWQRFFEDAAVADLIEHLALAQANSVIEFGCGTGRLAESLLAR